MAGWWGKSGDAVAAVDRPRLEISGPRLTQAFEALLASSETQGGIESYVRTVALKSSFFQETLADGGVRDLTAPAFKELCVFMAPVRRRVGVWLEENVFDAMREALVALFDGANDTGTADSRMTAFRARFPDDRNHRWVRDLAAEALHYACPESYPLMSRWVWDHRANTGVVREIWYGEGTDYETLDIGDGYQTFLVLREELSGFLTENGVFRDMPFYVDLLCAQVYAEYIGTQGGTYLRADFVAEDDPLQYVRRMLGLDGVNAKTGRTRLKLSGDEAFVLDGLTGPGEA